GHERWHCDVGRIARPDLATVAALKASARLMPGGNAVLPLLHSPSASEARSGRPYDILLVSVNLFAGENAPARSRTWIYRLGGGSGAIQGFRLISRFSPDLQRVSDLCGSWRFGPIRRDAVGFGQQIRLAAQ